MSDTNYTVPAPIPGIPPSPPAYPPYCVPPPKPPKLTSERRDVVLAVVLAVLCILTANLSFFGYFHLGFAVTYPLLLLCGGIYRYRRGAKVTGYSVLCTVTALMGTGVFLWHNDSVINFLCFCGMQLLTMLALVDTTERNPRKRTGIRSLLAALHRLVAYPLSHVGVALPAIFRVKQGDSVQRRRCGGVFLGLLCALPALVVVVPLLMSADAAFEGLLQHTILDNLGEMLASLALGAALFCVLFSRWFADRHIPVTEKPVHPSTFRGVDRLAINAFLSVISGVYVLYLFSQLAYFSSAFSGILPQDYTVAEYARRGFFEMCVLCAINLGVVAITFALSRREGGKAPLSTRLIQLFILLFSLGLVIVALSKMGLYIGSFGMTRLRLLTSVFMVMMGLVLLYIILRLFVVRFPYMQATVVTVALLGLLAAYGDVDTTVARYNVTAYEQSRLETVDVDMLSDLSDGATPYLVRLLDSKDTSAAYNAANALYWDLYDYGDVEGYTFTPGKAPDWRTYSVDAARKRALLLENADKIMSIKETGDTSDHEQEDYTDYDGYDYYYH